MMSIKSKIAYAAGDAGINLYFMSTMTFLLYFYTDYYGLSAATAAGVFLVARIVDAVSDPLMGYLADHTRTRWGRFRPYLVFGAVPLGLISVATFSIPDLGAQGKVVWAYTTYILFGLVYTVVTMPYAAMTSVLTNDHDERATLTTLRMGGAFLGALVVTMFMIPVVMYFGADNGFQITMTLMAVLGTLLLFWSFGGTEESVELAKPEQHLSISDAFRALFQNPPLWIVVSLFILGMLAFTFRQASAPYFFKYVMGREDLLTLYLTLTLLVMFIGLAVIPYLTQKFGKARTVQVGAIGAIAAASGFMLISPDNVTMVFVFGCLMAIAGAPIAVLGWAMLADTVEYAQHKHDVRADGVIYSTASFFQKVGKAVAGAAVPAVLAFTGYIANQDQPAEVMQGILICIAGVPLLANVLLLLIAFIYQLDAKTHGQLVSEIKERLHLAHEESSSELSR